MRRLLPLALAALLVAGPTAALSGSDGAAACAQQLLVLSAFPGEIDRLLVESTVTDTTTVDGHTFYIGRLRGNAVVLALTGIGLVNAEETARTALATFRCGSKTAITGMVFSGVAGGKSFIGDVTVPARWTLDDGKTWYPTDGKMFATARAVIRSGSIRLADRTPLGDLACIGLDPNLVSTVQMPKAPEIIVGGDGKSADPFGGRRFPCTPGGGDVFGCQPCRAPFQVPDVARFVEGAVPFADPNFFLGYFESPTPATTEWVAEDMESAAVARVARQNGIPFIAFRAMSDGQGDPLMLPGFPFQFFFYRQLAAENAAIVTLAFLQAWAHR